jgi:MFS family permease
MMGVAGQYSGNGLAYFNTVIYQKLGIKAVTEQLGYNLLYAFISALGALCGAILSDRMPRRKVLVFGTLGASSILTPYARTPPTPPASTLSRPHVHTSSLGQVGSSELSPECNTS